MATRFATGPLEDVLAASTTNRPQNQPGLWDFIPADSIFDPVPPYTIFGVTTRTTGMSYAAVDPIRRHSIPEQSPAICGNLDSYGANLPIGGPKRQPPESATL